MGAAPGVLQGRGREVAAIGTGDGRPEVQTVGIVDAIKAGNVDILTGVVSFYGLSHQAKGAGVLGSAFWRDDWFGQYWFVRLIVIVGN